jgi:hypothetical protein
MNRARLIYLLVMACLLASVFAAFINLGLSQSDGDPR